VSARKLHGVLAGLGSVRKALDPWVDERGGNALLDRLRATIDAEVQDDDDGLLFVYSGHGDAQYICGSYVRSRITITKCSDILRIFATHPRLAGKAVLVVFDNCRGLSTCCNRKAQFDDLGPKTLVAFSTRLDKESDIDPHRGCEYTNALADLLRDHARDVDIESILKLLNRKMKELMREKRVLRGNDFDRNEAPPISHNLPCQLFLGTA